jgi:hypothetical protein
MANEVKKKEIKCDYIMKNMKMIDAELEPIGMIKYVTV